MVNSNLMEMRGKLLDMEVKQSQFHELIEEKTDRLQNTVDKMEEGHVLRKFTEDEVYRSKVIIDEQIESLTKDMNTKFQDLIDTHLTKPGLIGEDEKYQTLINYTTTNIPSHNRRLKDIEEANEKFRNIQNQFQGRLHKAFGTDLPNQFKEVESA